MAAIVADAFRAGGTLRIEGGGAAAGLGRPVEADAVLSVAALAGVLQHEPAELFVTARAGTPVELLEATLAATGQRLPFEPVDTRVLMGGGGEPTMGGLVAGNWSGPRRIAAGSVRDHLLGARFVNGRGEAVKSGGRVVKNVTGLDLARLMCGAHGTLGVVTEATFKLLPIPERSATLVFTGLDDGKAVQALSAALGSPFEVSGAAHLPAGIGGVSEPRTLMRLDGVSTAVDYRLQALAAELTRYGTPAVREGEDASRLWRDIRDVRAFAGGEDAVWRVSVAPARGPSAAGLIGRERAGRCFFDWGGGLVWIATAPDGDAGAAAIRKALAVTGGVATLIRAPEAVRRAVPVFQPLEPGLAALTRRIKQSLDPEGVLNPGRMEAGH